MRGLFLTSFRPETPQARGDDAPADLPRIVLHCLEKEPDRRFQTARDLAFALEGIA